MNIHSCGYHCDKPGCIKAQRDDLVKKFIVNARKPLTEDEIAEIAMDCSFVSESDIYFARAIEKAHGIGGDETFQRKPLTDQEIIEAIKHISHNEMSAFAIARAIEKVLK